MIRTALALAIAAFLALPAAAQDDVSMIEGLWTGSGEGELTVDLSHIDGEIYGISIETVVPIENDMPGCAGGIDGEVILTKKGGNFFVENADYDPDSPSPVNAPICEIGMAFDGQGGLTIEERDGCLSYHGASCGFTGELMHDAAGL